MDSSTRRFLAEILVFIAGALVITLAVAVVGAVIVPAPAQPVTVDVGAAASPGCFDAPVVLMTDAGPSGTARLCILDDAVRPSMRVVELRAGNAYTAWLQYYDRPARCQTAPCGVADLVGDNPAGVLSRMDAVVANGTGKADLWGDFRDLRLSSDSQLRLVLADHGIANVGDNRARARQLLTLQVPRLGPPLAGAAADGELGTAVAHAVFNLP
jgi:hypothetical protein